MSVVKPFYIKENMTEPYYPFKIVDSAGKPIDLTDKTLKCTLKNLKTGAFKIDDQETGINITNLTQGEGEYQWQSGDTDTPGKYCIQFPVDDKFTVPPDDGAIVTVTKR